MTRKVAEATTGSVEKVIRFEHKSRTTRVVALSHQPREESESRFVPGPSGITGRRDQLLQLSRLVVNQLA